jgi:hypothetical protein
MNCAKAQQMLQSLGHEKFVDIAEGNFTEHFEGDSAMQICLERIHFFCENMVEVRDDPGDEKRKTPVSEERFSTFVDSFRFKGRS